MAVRHREPSWAPMTWAEHKGVTGWEWRRHTTILLLAVASSLKPLCCVFWVPWWKTGGHVCSLLFKGKLIFLDLVDQVEEHNLFHLCQDEPRCETLSASICVCADTCVHSGVPRSTVWSLVLLRWCRVSGPAPLGRGRPPAGTHRAGCWTPLISLHCWLLHTPLLSASRASKHHLSSVTPPKQHPPPPPTTLSAAPPYWFPPRSDFPRPVSCSSSFLTNYAVKLMAPSPKLQPLWNTFHDPP